jgi:hypothetical protein
MMINIVEHIRYLIKLIWLLCLMTLTKSKLFYTQHMHKRVHEYNYTIYIYIKLYLRINYSIDITFTSYIQYHANIS